MGNLMCKACSCKPYADDIRADKKAVKIISTPSGAHYLDEMPWASATERQDASIISKPSENCDKNSVAMQDEVPSLLVVDIQKEPAKAQHITEPDVSLKQNIEDNKITIDLLEAHGLARLDCYQFVKLATLQMNESEEIYKCLRKKDGRIFLARTYFTAGLTERQVQETYARVIFERDIAETLMNSESQTINKYQGAFYSTDEKEQLQSMTIISVSAIFSLQDVLRIRGEEGAKWRSYSSAELLSIWTSIIKALKTLQESRVYHSNINLSNLVINLDSNTYQIADFSSSRMLPSGSDIIRDSVYTKNEGHHSPEFYRIIQKQKQERQDEDASFNPFKDDVWALGCCFTKMLDPNQTLDEKARNFLDIMLEEDWEKRPDAVELEKYIRDKGLDNYCEVCDVDRQIVTELEEAFLRVELARRIEKAREGDEVYQVDIGWLHYRLGYILKGRGCFDEALVHSDAAIDIGKNQTGGADQELVLVTLALIGSILSITGQHQKALVVFEELLETEKKLYSTEECEEAVKTLLNIAFELGNLKQHKKSSELYQKILELQKIIYKAEEHEEIAKTLSHMGVEIFRLEDYQKALEIWEKVLQMKLNIYKTEENISIVTTLNNIASAQSKLARHEAALKEHKRVLELRLKIYKTEINADVAQSFNNVGMKLFDLGDQKEALVFLNRALEIYRSVFGVDKHPKIAQTRKNIDYVRKRNSV